VETFRHLIEVRWSDCDANQHVLHSTYAEFCTHTRIEWLRAHGFSFEQFQASAFGPVMFREWTEYYKELKMSERVTVEVRCAGLSHDGSRFRIRHDLYKEDGRLAAAHEVTGAWFDLKTRKLMVPPPELRAIFENLMKSDDFAEIPLKSA